MLLIFLLLSVVSCKLVFVATVFRHGARYPLGDIYDGNQTKQFHGRLTSVGMRQQFLLGGYLKADYIDKAKLINATLYPKEVQVFADGSERCVQSAIAHLLGLFPYGTGLNIPENLNKSYLNPPFQTFLQGKQPFKQGSDLAGQFALKMGFQPVPYINSTAFWPHCPNEQNIMVKRVESLAVKLAQFQAVHAAFTQKMRIVFNLKAQYANVAGLAQLFDVVICDLNLGRPMPVQFTDYDFKQLRYIENYLFDIIYGGHVAPIFTTNIVAAILGNMQNIIKNKQKQVKKYSIYSGHDSNIVPLLNFFNLTSPECITKKWMNESVVGNCADVPPFASNLVFQLHQNDVEVGKYYVRLRYNGDYFYLCEKSAKQCEYSQFASRSRHQFVDVAKQCGIKSEKEQKKKQKVQKNNLMISQQ